MLLVDDNPDNPLALEGMLRSADLYDPALDAVRELTKEIVRAHGGTVDVASSEAAGTTFRVTLPRGATPGAAAAGPMP